MKHENNLFYVLNILKVKNGTAFLGAGDLIIYYERHRIVDFIHPPYRLVNSILTKKPGNDIHIEFGVYLLLVSKPRTKL